MYWTAPTIACNSIGTKKMFLSVFYYFRSIANCYYDIWKYMDDIVQDLIAISDLFSENNWNY